VTHGSPGAPDVPLVQLDDVCLRIGDTPVLDHLTLEIPGHGVTVVLGPSGAGKSTLLRLVNRLEAPTSGTVRYRGEDVASLDPLSLRRRVGMVFQRPTPFPGTVRDNLRVAAPRAFDHELVALLERCGLPEDFLDRDTAGLSGGEAQRVCLARALAVGPEALLMDEPTASLDPDNRALVEEQAVALAASRLPIVWVTHDLAQADRLATSHVEPRGAAGQGADHGHVIVLVEGRRATPAEADAFRRHRPDRDDRPGARP
jgi:putative ABC transport system ATP-binding protein